MTKSTRVLDALTLIVGIFTLLCYANFTVNSILIGAGAREVIIGSFVTLLVASVLAFGRKLHRVLRWILCLGMCFYVLSYSIFALTLILPSHDSVEALAAEDDEALILVFGCRSFGLEPGNQLRSRLDHAHSLYLELDGAKFLVSGGQGKNETEPEAMAMRAYLIEKGVPEEDILTECASSSTEENIAYSIPVIKEQGLDGRRIIAVSSYYHMPRIKLLAQREGLEVMTSGSGNNGILGFFTSDIVREYMAYIKMYLRALL